jgi:hypothetical protein
MCFETKDRADARLGWAFLATMSRKLWFKGPRFVQVRVCPTDRSHAVHQGPFQPESFIILREI